MGIWLALIIHAGFGDSLLSRTLAFTRCEWRMWDFNDILIFIFWCGERQIAARVADRSARRCRVEMDDFALLSCCVDTAKAVVVASMSSRSCVS